MTFDPTILNDHPNDVFADVYRNMSGPAISWQIEVGNNGNGDRFYFLGLKITADSDCSHEIKRCLLLARKAMTNLDSVLKKQRYYFAYKHLNNQRYGFFPVVL